jgi:uncharacterized protein
MLPRNFLTNREHTLAVFLCTTLLLLNACAPQQEHDTAGDDIDTTDIYAMEVRKDRLEKDKYLLTSPASPIKASDMTLFKRLAYYPVNREFVFPTVLRRLEVPEEVTIATTRDESRHMLHIGALPFSHNGGEYVLQVFAPKDTTDDYYWFIPFTDATNGKDTYAGGRYLDIDNIVSDSVFLDFNYAYNPYCAYNEGYDCPIPPAGNALPIPITAGERNYPLQPGK